ncbi:hypothetical protein B0H10DRAFT_1671959, partial [Mycena sp. CBHHK59/15]
IDDLDAAIVNDQDDHIRHGAVEVTQSEFPFNSKEAGVIFSNALREIKAAEIILEDLGVSKAEWEGRFYGETERIKVGKKNVEIVLPFSIWLPRAVAWAQGLELM